MTSSIVIVLIFSFVLANLPWLSERFYIVFPPPNGKTKTIWMRLLEWLSFGCMSLLLALGLESKDTGATHEQDWEFYAIFLSLFAVFAFPSFIYRHLIVHLLARKSL